MLKGYGGYTQAYQKVAVNTVDQRKLIVMLYDGAIKFLGQATENLNAGQHFEAHSNMIRGKSIIAELLASLNMEHGGDIAKNLQRLYAFMFNELIEANLHKDGERVNGVIHLLKELRVAWKNVKPEPGAAIGATASAASPTVGTPSAAPSRSAGAQSNSSPPGAAPVTKRIQVKG
jgi:flagellar protein FliS